MHLHRFTAALSLWLTLAFAAPGQEKIEKHPDGSVFRRYAVDKAGEKEGKFEEFDADGNLSMNAVFVKGKLEGKASYFEDGKVVRTLSFKAGAPQYERSLEEMQKVIRDLEAGAKEEKDKALARLKAYRYLVGVAYEDVELDENYMKWAQAGAELIKELKRLEHHPKNPGWPEEKFKLAYKGTSSSSLSWGDKDLVVAVDGWMNDSDEGNIEHLGHRRWIIDPMMKKTGFGRAGAFSVMYTFDQTRKKAPDFDTIAYPPPGHTPAGFFGRRHAWNISLHPAKYKEVTKAVKPAIYLLDELGMKKEALELDYTGINTIPFGVPYCIIFRPAKLDVSAGKRYLVEISGVQTRTKGETVLRYVVEFAGK